MDPVGVAQVANPILQTVFIVVIGLGYYFSIRETRKMGRATNEMVREMREVRTTGGRPLVTVSEDYESLPSLNLVVQNIGSGPARNISFEFSSPIASSDGFVLSELPIFREGITDLAPSAKIVGYWDRLGNLLPMIEAGRLQREVSVTVRYEDLLGTVYHHTWAIAPWRYEGLRNVDYGGMSDLVSAVQRLAEQQRIANEGVADTEDRKGREGRA
ncbi:Hypothetical Protein RradSPS_1862 [Rubrobacter radiotolerans]|uniref:Preprotein translocase subunit YajC n=1 Tax=Rubrobacter radiotolerans TaxID=42256 RepID=A0A023X579_RUBRA|nr:preprotein translocase subunit YajC [Rubrobacter radiotolerans]AHY47145.1 Hypothetical Protein RradSPS_1862 [Rubrobacter radiotolerans]MDX5894551.1 preprotein translocase subunit YajC [Rubrobacter radiotolerans]SMC06236.1 hypothetical protein SAMN00767673_1864 [Rubrobacter radiotolerans DSM 5868]